MLSLSSIVYVYILQIADVALRVVFFLFLSVLETSEVSAIFIFTTKTTQPRSHGALTFKNPAFCRHFLVKVKILPNLVISNWLW